MKLKINYNIVLYALLLLVLSLLCFPSDSPLYNFIETDVAIFRFVGSTIPQGFVLFKDIFDHKGPLVFFINALGYLFSNSSQWGYFILAFLALYFSCYYSYLISKKANLNKWILMVYPFVMTFILSGTIGQTENFALVFNSIALFIVFRNLYDNRKNLSNNECYLIGILLGLSFLTKVTNCFVIIGICVFYFIDYLKSKEYKELLYSIGRVLIAFIGVNLTFLIYFVINDAVEEYIFASFTANLIYSDNNSSFEFSSFIIRNIGFVIPAVFSYLHTNNKRIKLFIVIANLFAIIGQNIGGIALHYRVANLTLYAYCFALGVMYLKKKWPKVVYLSLPLFLFLKSFAMSVWKVPTYGLYYRNADDVAQQFKNEYAIDSGDKVIILNSPPCMYFLLDVLPSLPYFTLQDHWSEKFDSKIHDDIIDSIINKDFDYIITTNKNISNNSKLVDSLNQNYELDTMYQADNYKGNQFTLLVYQNRK